MNKYFLYLYFILFIGLNTRGQVSNLTPFQIPDLQLWLRSDSLVSLNQDSVYQWDDISINLRHAIQLTKSSQPHFIGNIFKLNNKPVIKFDGVNDFMSFTSLNVGTVFILVKHDIPSTSYNTLFGNSTSYRWHGGVNQNLFNNYVETSNIINGQGYVNGNSILPINMEKPSEYSILELQPSNLHPAERITGDNPGDNGASFWKGDFAEIIIYDRILTNSERTQVEDYLFFKYAPPVVLPGDITINNSFCDTTISPAGYYADYLWSTGAITSSISVNSSGKYWVKATNIFGKVSSDTILVSYPGNFLSQNSILCKGDSLVWNTNLPHNPYTFQWQNNTTDSLFTIKQGGQYYVKITDGNGCSINSNTITITQDNFPTIASLGPDVSLCAGNSITLVSGISSSLTYTWSTGSNNSSLLVNTSGQYSVVVTNTNNCVAKDTINVSISGFAPISNFTTNVGCVNSIVSFTDLSIPPSGNTITSYSWNFGDIPSGAANTSTLANPSHTYTNTGTYTVSLRVTTNAGCEQTTIKTLTVFPKPIVNFVSGNSCQNDSTAFSSLCTSVAGYSITSLNWNFGDPGSANTSNLINPKHLFSNQANYTIKLVATNNVGCKDSLINIIAVKAQVKADFTYSTPCTNTATVFQDNSIVPAPNSSNTRTWNFGSLGTSNGLTPTKTYTSSGVYYVTLSVTGINGCSSSITKLITIFSPPIASFSVPTICAKDTFTITNTSLAQSGIISTNDWKINNNHFSSILNPTLSINAAGTYSVKLTTTNSFGCENSTTNTITVNVIPNVDFTTVPSSYYYINSPITLTPNITNASSYLWNISNYAPTSIFSPTVTFTNEGDYTASLFLVDQSGCKNSITKTLSVSKRFLDAAILNVISNKDNDGFMTVQADIANYGSIPVSTLDLNYQVSDGGNIKETWNGMLNPGSFLSYTFSSKTSTQLSSSNNITCVEIKKVNTINDENESNNTLCGSLNSDEISVSNPIPNPTNADITLPIILNKDIDITISIYNSTGQIQYEDATQKGTTGLNLITLSTSNYSRGCYIIKVNIDDKVFIKKFIKISNQ